MRVLRPILHRLIRSPMRRFVIDDQRSWRGIDLYVGALHLARQIERETDRETVGFMLPTSGLSPMALIAIWMLGRTAVPLNYLLKLEDIDYVCRDAGLDTVITVGPMIDYIGGSMPECARALRLDEMSFKGLPPMRRSLQRDDDHLATLLYTSGTSGKPKGVMLTSSNLAANVDQAIRWAGFGKNDTFLGVLPQFHSFGFTVLTLMPLSVGAPVVYTARFTPRRIFQLLTEHRPTVLLAIPSMYAALLGSRGAKADVFSSLRCVVSGGEPLPKAVAEGFHELGVTINEGYGLTETAPVANWCRPEEHRPGSVGMALPGIEEKIVDPTGQRLAANLDGEICIKGPNVMAGYFNLPEQTDAVFDEEGFFRTGDMGRFDDDGHLYITGRIKEMLIIGGENVFPREIEEVLNAHPAVQASAVIGVHDDSRGEVAMAFVELVEGAEVPSDNELRSFCRGGLAQYKVPREVRIMESLPRNPTGKIMRRELTPETPGVEST